MYSYYSILLLFHNFFLVFLYFCIFAIFFAIYSVRLFSAPLLLSLVLSEVWSCGLCCGCGVSLPSAFLGVLFAVAVVVVVACASPANCVGCRPNPNPSSKPRGEGKWGGQGVEIENGDVGGQGCSRKTPTWGALRSREVNDEGV